MAHAIDKHLHIVESELNFLRRHLQNILTEDFGGIDDAGLAIRSALQALKEYKLYRHGAGEELASHVAQATYS